MKKRISSTLIIAIVAVLFIAIVAALVVNGNKYTERRYDLYELSDDVYATYYTTHSAAPAYNYEVITICCNGTVCTFEGDVTISFTNGKPYATVKDYNMVGGDEIHVYVPYSTVAYQPSVSVK